MKKQFTSVVTSAIIFLNGCAGRTANPVSMYQPGDQNRSCQSLQTEMSQIKTQIVKKQKISDDRFWYNGLCFAGGFFIIAPWFLMDLKDAEKTEIEALQNRHDYLLSMAAEKNCSFIAQSR